MSQHVVINSSCIDLTFALQPNFVNKSGVYSSFHMNCHHQLKFARFNWNTVYPPLFERNLSTPKSKYYSSQ